MKELETNVVIRAKLFARAKHEGMFLHTVSGDKKPQLEHIQEVVDLVWASGGSDAELAAAWLHDTVEDTGATLEEIEGLFGSDVRNIVHGLTDSKDIEHLPNLKRKTKQAERIKGESETIRKIKIADQISNIRLMVLDPKNTWTFENNRDYIIGAKRIADNCRGISRIFDDLFDREYERAKHYFDLNDNT